MLKTISLLIFPIIFFTACKTARETNRASVEEIMYLDSLRYGILPFDAGYFKVKDPKETTLSYPERIQLENILASYFEKKWNPELMKNADSVWIIQTYGKDYKINLARYVRQYIPALDDDGNKIVFVNCVCNTNGRDFRKEMIFVADGGKCYFHLYINLTKKTIYDLYINTNA
jgi:hypothetical protein